MLVIRDLRSTFEFSNDRRGIGSLRFRAPAAAIPRMSRMRDSLCPRRPYATARWFFAIRRALDVCRTVEGLFMKTSRLDAPPGPRLQRSGVAAVAFLAWDCAPIISPSALPVSIAGACQEAPAPGGWSTHCGGIVRDDVRLSIELRGCACALGGAPCAASDFRSSESTNQRQPTTKSQVLRKFSALR